MKIYITVFNPVITNYLIYQVISVTLCAYELNSHVHVCDEFSIDSHHIRHQTTPFLTLLSPKVSVR